MYDLGTSFNEYSGKDKHQCVVMWELDGITITVKDEDGNDVEKPQSISEWYTLSLHEKAKLRQHLEAWRGQAFTPEELAGFEIKKLLGKCCQIQVVHEKKQNGKIKAKITSIMAMPKGMPKPELVNEIKYFTFDEDDKDSMKIEDVSKGLQRLIKMSNEWEEKEGNKPDSDDAPPTKEELEDDNLPF